MRDRIIKECVTLIQQKGFSFTISDLANRLSKSKRTIYQYFDSKDQMIAVIIDELIIEITRMEEQILNDQDISLIDKISKMLCYVPEEFEVLDIRLLSDLKKHHYETWEKLDHFLKEEWTTVLSLVEDGIYKGLIRPINKQLFIDLYIGALNQIANPAYASRNSLTFKERLQSLVDILLNGICTEKTDH